MRFEFSDQIRKLLHFGCLLRVRRALPPSLFVSVCPRVRVFYLNPEFLVCDAFWFVPLFSFTFWCVRSHSACCLSSLSVSRYLKRLKWVVAVTVAVFVVAYMRTNVPTQTHIYGHATWKRVEQFWTNILVHSNCSYSGASNTHFT